MLAEYQDSLRGTVLEEDEQDGVGGIGEVEDQKMNVGAWANSVFGGGRYQKEQIEMSGKMTITMEIIKEARKRGNKTLVFSQYQTTLDVIQTFIKSHNLVARKQTHGMPVEQAQGLSSLSTPGSHLLDSN